MTRRTRRWLVTTITAAALVATVEAAEAVADPNLPYGPNTCASGFVWRAAQPGDAVCVSPNDRDRTAQENATNSARVDPNGPYGPQSCMSGFVWRQAFNGDAICVTPDTRRENLDWNNYKCGLLSYVQQQQAKGAMTCPPPPPAPADLGNYPGYLS